MPTPHDPRSDSKPDGSLATGGRRRAARRESSASLRVFVETAEFDGQADNFSPHGVFFFSDEHVRVRVEVEEEGRKKSYTGKLVRVQQINADESGFAVEFDRS